MTTGVIHNKVHYKIFDRTHQSLSLIFSPFKFSDTAKLAEVALNRQIVAKELAATAVYFPKQVHGKEVILVDSGTDCNKEVEADGVITATPGIAIAIQTADCVPVLLACETGAVIGAVHCGWRSAKAGIIKETVKQMRFMGSDQITAIIGPSIQQHSYEVSGDYYYDFLEDSNHHSEYFIPSIRQGHYMFDLPAFVIGQLKQEDIRVIKHINEDTYSLSNKYPSCRRSYHAGKKYEQNLLSTIIIKNHA